MTPPGGGYYIQEEKRLDELPQRRHTKVGGEDIYNFRTQRAAERFINNNAHLDLRVEILAHDSNTNFLTRFFSNADPGDYHHAGYHISGVHEGMHEFRSLSDFLKDNAPVRDLEDARFDYYQIQVHQASRSGNLWGRMKPKE